jgi:riboflavin synthase
VARDGEAFAFQAGPETLRRTNLGEVQAGMRVNLERSLRVGDRLGGHIVQGHVDGLGTIARRERQGEWEFVWFRCGSELARYMVPKGSVAVDGISLTLVDVTADGFSVALIPHTMAATTLGHKQPAATVNLEVDLFAKYVFRCVEQMRPPLGG